MIGLILGVATGVAMVSVREYTDSSVRSAEALALATRLPVLAGIPEIRTVGDLRRRRRMRFIQVAAVVAICIGGLAVFHFWIMDLHIFWAKLMRRLAI